MNERAYFWRAKNRRTGAAEKIEDWHILARVRGHAHDVRDLNRFLLRRFRAGTMEWPKSRYRKIPKPLGAEEILWGYKVISVVNESWRNVFPEEGALATRQDGRAILPPSKSLPHRP